MCSIAVLQLLLQFCKLLIVHGLIALQLLLQFGNLLIENCLIALQLLLQFGDLLIVRNKVFLQLLLKSDYFFLLKFILRKEGRLFLFVEFTLLRKFFF